jgi:4-hydroxy-3-methylbut-2-en-1-yl diphosphate reductase
MIDYMSIKPEAINIISVPKPEKFGFCRGVVAADNFLRNISAEAGKLGIGSVYGFNGIVHNETVKNEHQARGVKFISEISDIPQGAIVVGSAHGNGPQVEHTTTTSGGLYFEGACPLVLHVHKAVQTARSRGQKVLYLLSGKPDEETEEDIITGQRTVNPSKPKKLHDEVAGTIGHMDSYLVRETGELVWEPVRRSYIELTDDPDEIEGLMDEGQMYLIISQTTLHARRTLDYRKKLAMHIENEQPEATINRIDSKDVCQAVSNRQDGVTELLKDEPDMLVVVTDPKSKNGMGYYDQAQQEIKARGLNTKAIHIATLSEIGVISGGGKVAVTASASTPDKVTRSIVEALGGDSSLVPLSRPSFKLSGSNVEAIRNRIEAWKG